MKAHVPLLVRSEFSFLNGASRLEELVKRATELGYEAMALTDLDHLCGVPEYLGLCDRYQIKPLLGTELTLESGRIVALARTRRGYSCLCKLLTQSHLENERRQPSLPESQLHEHAEDLILIAGGDQAPFAKWIYERKLERARDWLSRQRGRFGSDFRVRIERTFAPLQAEFNSHLCTLCKNLDIPIVAGNPMCYARPEQYRVFDVLCCIRNLITVDEPHPERAVNDRGYLASPESVASLFADMPEALCVTRDIADRCELFSLRDSSARPRFPDVPLEQTNRHLCELTYLGAHRKYGTVSNDLKFRLDYELQVIADLDFAGYFLIMHDLLTFARSREIRYAGRGSSADSVVAYCLDITKVDAFARNLRFERFINPERSESLPDIDVDFDRRYRDDIVNYVVNKYGQEYVAGVASFNRYRARGAIRDVAKVLGFKEEDIDLLAKRSHWALSAKKIASTHDSRPEIRALQVDKMKFQLLFELCAGLDDLPRHISAHPCGVMVTGTPVQEITPLLRAANGMLISHYDKDGIEDLGLAKFDLLSLPTLGVVEDAAVMVRSHEPKFDYDHIPLDDEQTFELLRSGE
ncbi:MAG: DNA polymerase III subunit alpha, partial [Planctomycetes bacterium]|nr:DNA polymerase III subunit alpha [Planctomycetota bacterium]